MNEIGILEYGTGIWKPDNGLGYHRIIIRVAQKADVVFVRIPWRCRRS